MDDLFQDDPDMPDLQPVSDSEDDVDDDVKGDDGWFSEVGEEFESDMDTEEISGVDWSECSLLVDVVTDLGEAAAHAEPANAANEITQFELIDSGCTSHITPHPNEMEHFIEIPEKSFHAANQQSFKAVGKGEMVIDIPNGVNVSQLRLTEVLYSPEVGYTLVSVGHLDNNGFSLLFGGGKCTITGPDGEYIGSVPKTMSGLYHVAHEPVMANTAIETLSVDQFHQWMGHISPEIAQKLVEKGFVTGMKLETMPSGDSFFCESCVYAKAI